MTVGPSLESFGSAPAVRFVDSLRSSTCKYSVLVKGLDGRERGALSTRLCRAARNFDPSLGVIGVQI